MFAKTNMMERNGHYNWIAYKKSFAIAGSVYRMSEQFPKIERFSLTDQVRRSSRAVCANIAESYGCRRYLKQFRLKLSYAKSENYETQTWIDFALQCGYITQVEHQKYFEALTEVGKLLTYMENHPKTFMAKPFKEK